MSISYIITINTLNNIPNDEITINSTYSGDFVTYNNFHILDSLQYGGNILYEVTYNKKKCRRWTDCYGRIIIDTIKIKNKYALSNLSTFEYLHEIGSLKKKNDQILYWACKKGYQHIVEYLLNNDYIIHNEIPLENVAFSNNINLFIYIYKKTNELNILINKDYLLVLASYKGNLEIIKYLMCIGANMNAHDNLPIYLYALYNHVDALIFALNFNVDIHIKDNYIFKFAKNNGHDNIIKLLENYKKK